MKKCCFFLISILAAIVALSSHIIAREKSIESTAIRAHSWNHSDAEKQQMKSEADRCATTASVWFYTGTVFALCGLACLLLARWRNEQPGWYWIPIIMLVIDFLVQRLL